MSLTEASAELRAAADRFRGFFQELGRTFIERDDLLVQVALALLGREHVLMTGPPGTAKSGIAAAVLGRIVDERTGKPSVFARQFTESTVQTDLVGPIDFKTLMQTGRTEHFTDEGMLGAVHAFLDEVLDGRDMLLRTTLNVLHERELKQGTKTTAGQIECALMTTNRYLAEVLESSRETLLAFVDRIAFVSFVPKGFAHPESMGKVLRFHTGGTKPRPLVSLLTIQDLDVLQDAVDRVVVPDEICTALCGLVAQLDGDLAAAAKHDPTFMPTRYLSTRTVVRLGKVLRAICVYDAIMREPGRALEVEQRDLALLRLSLLLSGPDAGKLGDLLAKESDPRERRQLSILRTEREIFDRAIARMPKVERRRSAKTADVGALERAAQAALPVVDPKPVLAVAAKLAEASDGGGPGSMQAAALLDKVLNDLAERAARTATTAGAGPHEGAADVVTELATLADGLEKTSGTTRPVARWLRGRAIRILLDQAALASSNAGALLDAKKFPLDEAMRHSEKALAAIEHVVATMANLRAAGADAEPDPAALATAVKRVEDQLVEIWDTGFREAVATALGRVGTDHLGALLAAVGPVLADIDTFGARLDKITGGGAALKSRVVAPRIEPLVRAAFARVEARDRLELVNQAGILVGHLEESGLKGIVPNATILEFAIAALVRTEARGVTPRALSADFSGYRDLRTIEQRVSLAYAAVELALRIAPEKPDAKGSPDALTGGLVTFIATLPEALRKEIVELDLARIGRAVGLVESWWKKIAGQDLEKLAESKFFHVAFDEGALLRFALETRVIADVFAEAKDRVEATRARIDAIEASSMQQLDDLRRQRADAAWTTVLGPQ
jgi:MoxR-like ATPase